MIFWTGFIVLIVGLTHLDDASVGHFRLGVGCTIVGTILLVVTALQWWRDRPDGPGT